jgi:hypothetical protein
MRLTYGGARHSAIDFELGDADPPAWFEAVRPIEKRLAQIRKNSACGGILSWRGAALPPLAVAQRYSGRCCVQHVPLPRFRCSPMCPLPLPLLRPTLETQRLTYPHPTSFLSLLPRNYSGCAGEDAGRPRAPDIWGSRPP